MKKILIAFFMILITEGYSWAVLTGWFCGGCISGNIAMSQSTTYCQENPCDESCYYCGDTVTPQSLAITGGTRYWNEVCPNTGVLTYCYKGSPAACDTGGMLE